MMLIHWADWLGIPLFRPWLAQYSFCKGQVDLSNVAPIFAVIFQGRVGSNICRTCTAPVRGFVNWRRLPEPGVFIQPVELGDRVGEVPEVHPLEFRMKNFDFRGGYPKAFVIDLIQYAPRLV